jgi:MoaA/NifB/PqqE/SkfB family radical SAM enzyme
MDRLRVTRSAKSYGEAGDLTILFNTAAMSHNNPLLVLNAYGSLVWRGITGARRIADLRGDARRAFGVDEVVPFAQRLMRLGFLEQDPELLAEAADGETIVKEIPAPEAQFSLTQARVPWYCLWELCTTCDLRCRICYLPQFRDPGPSRDEAMRLIEQIVDAGIFYVGLLGGEVLLRDDLEEIVAALRANAIFVKIITNGQRLTAPRAAALAAAGLNQLEVSFDGMHEVMHEASRGPGSFVRAVDALRNAAAAGIPRLGMVLTVHADNVDELEEVPAFMRRYGVTDCYVSLFKKTGLLGSKSAYEPPRAEARQRFIGKLQAVRENANDLRISLLSECSCARTSIVIGADQQLRLCTFEYDNVVGDLRRETLAELWASLADRTAEAGPLGFCRPASDGRTAGRQS